MAKIAIDARESGTSTGRYIDKLIEHLHQLQPAHEITILTKADRLEFMRGIAPQFTVIETPFAEFSFGEQLGFKKQLDNLKVDLVHFGMVQQPVRYRGRVVTTMHDLTTLRFKNPAKNPIVFTIKQHVYKWVNKRAAHKSTYVITPTEFVKKDVVAFTGINPKKVVVTYEAADKITDPPEAIADLQNKRFIMYVGRPQPHKNLERLVEAFSGLKDQHPDLWLVIAGKKDNVMQKLEQNTNKQGVGQVYFTNWISDAQLCFLYEHTAGYVFPSLSEGFGLPPLEAMIHGAPVAASNATCIPEVCKDGALYFDPLDVPAMTASLHQLLTDEALRKKLIANGKKVAASYSWQRTAEQTLAVYENALKN